MILFQLIAQTCQRPDLVSKLNSWEFCDHFSPQDIGPWLQREPTAALLCHDSLAHILLKTDTLVKCGKG